MLKFNRLAALFVVTLGLLAFAAPGCNTTEGAGKDIKATGRAIENAADDAKN